jgi:putative (di)nucleoside polyphosphate hydrolase
MTTETFRANVGIALIKDTRVIVFERSDISGAWQLPQGGIDVSEEPLDAAYRELHEETGLSREAVRLKAEYPEWLVYETPSSIRRKGWHLGQAQRWFIFELIADEADIDLQYHTHQEFIQYRWIEVSKLESIVVDFRKPIYRKLTTFIQNL